MEHKEIARLDENIMLLKCVLILGSTDYLGVDPVFARSVGCDPSISDVARTFVRALVVDLLTVVLLGVFFKDLLD